MRRKRTRLRDWLSTRGRPDDLCSGTASGAYCSASPLIWVQVFGSRRFSSCLSVEVSLTLRGVLRPG